MIANIYYSSYVQRPIKGFTVVTYWRLTKFIRIGHFISLHLHSVDEETKVRRVQQLTKRLTKLVEEMETEPRQPGSMARLTSINAKPIEDFKFQK